MCVVADAMTLVRCVPGLGASMLAVVMLFCCGVAHTAAHATVA